ncbi:MAG: helix-turn-helix domain-containing protein [Bdellovibrionaceae bacterium]|jgi:DNA-binding MarR family transcriptional regulator|nr:helix-turn-helix domain-containing protein [Pseudobdellovibrionaceae bacterium]
MNPKELFNIHPLLMDRTRLAIMALLNASEEAVSFNMLIEALSLTKGNASSHIRNLEKEKLVKVTKKIIDRKTKTTYQVTPLGKKEFSNYLITIQQLINK